MPLTSDQIAEGMQEAIDTSLLDIRRRQIIDRFGSSSSLLLTLKPSCPRTVTLELTGEEWERWNGLTVEQRKAGPELEFIRALNERWLTRNDGYEAYKALRLAWK